MLAKSKIISIILAIIFSVSAITCGIVFGVSKSKPQSTATTESATLTTNLFNTNGTINSTAANALLDAVGYYDYSASTTGYTAHNIAGRTSNNSGKSIIFKMGYANGTSGTALVWQATYLYNNYLTIWLDKNYTASTWNSTSVTVSYDSYENSTIQTYLDDTLYETITQNSSTLQSIFATPREAGYQTIKSGTTNDTNYWYGSGGLTTKFDNMASGVADSYLWLPSFGEVCNNTTSSFTESTTSYTGQWKVNNTDRSFATSCYDGSSETVSFCWLRSGTSNDDVSAMVIYESSITSMCSDVDDSCGVRPACHISLDVLNDLVAPITYTGSNYTLTLSNNGDGTATIEDCTMTTTGSIVIPSVVNGLTITKIVDGEADSDGYTGVFMNCANYLTGITLPDTITYIGDFAFKINSKLSSINLPENLEALGAQVFEGVNVTNYILPEKVKELNGTFAYSKITSIQLNEGLEVLGAAALKNTQITELTIPSSVIKIEVSAVTDCSNLTRVKFECDIDNVVFDDSACFGYNNSSVNYVLSSKQDMEKAITLTSVFNDGTFSYESIITLNYNGATGGNTTKELLCAGDSTTTATYGTLPTPTKTNYKFEGWYKNADFSGNAVTNSDEVVDSHILYAKWSDKSVSFVTPNNGAEIDTQTTNQSETIIANNFVFSTNNYIATIQLGISEVIDIKTQLGAISGGEYCTAVRYTANISGSSILIEVINIKKNLEITLGFVNTPQTLKESGANVEGIAVKCTKGGVAYYIADDFDSLADTDTITFVTKQVLQGYTFSHWQDLDGNNLGTEMSIKLTKAQVMDNIITAVYVQSVNSSVNDQVNN